MSHRDRHIFYLLRFRSSLLLLLVAVLTFVALFSFRPLFSVQAVAASARQPAQLRDDGFWYTVQPGDTLSRLSMRFGITVNDLVQANRIDNPNLIWVGQRLWIPGSGTTPPSPTAAPTATPGGGFWYTVARGDTLGRLSTRFGVSLSALISANSIVNPNLIFVGQRLWVPGQEGAPTPTPPPVATPTPMPTATSAPPNTPQPTATPTARGFWYTVQAGDSLSSIATRFGTSVAGIVQANNLANPNVITVGQRLWISGSGSTPSPATPGTGFDYGFNVDPWAGNLDTVIRDVQNAGFHWVKFQVPWRDVETADKGQYRWGNVDGVVDRFHAAGLNVLISIVKAPRWARPAQTNFAVDGPPANNQDFVDFLTAFAQRYRGKVQAVELWNEPNLHSEWGDEPLNVSRYVDMLCKGHTAIKAQDPAMQVISAGLTPTGINDGRNAIDDIVYLRSMYWHGVKGCFDALGAHPSGYNNPPDARFGYSDPNEPDYKNHPSFFFQETLLRYRSVMNAFGDSGKRVWVTEFGWASSTNPSPGYEYAADVTLTEQATYLVKALQLMRQWGWVGPACVWNLNYNQTNPDSEMAQFSVLDRLAYTALRDMAK